MIVVIFTALVTAIPSGSQGQSPWAWFRIQDKASLGLAAGPQCPRSSRKVWGHLKVSP